MLRGGIMAAVFLAITATANEPTLSHDQLATLIQQTQRALLKKPGDMQLSFVLAMAYQASGRHDLAIAIFRGMLNVDPGALRPRLELAKSLHLTEQYDESLYHLEQVANHPLPPGVIRSIRALITDIKTRRPRFTYDIFFIQDSNPSQATADPTITMRGVQYVLSQDARQRRARGVKGVFKSHIPLSVDTGWFTEIQAQHTEYDMSEINFSAAQVTLGNTYAVDDSSRLTAQIGPLATRYGDSPLYDGYVASLAITRLLTDQYILSSAINGRQLDYDRLYQGYDAVSLGYDISMLYIPSTTRRWIITLSALDHDADQAFNGFHERSLAVSFNQELTGGWRLGAEYMARNRTFNAPDPLFAATRDDTTREWLLSVANINLKVFDLTPKLMLQASSGQSTNDLHDFDRQSLSIGLGRVF